MNKLLRASLAAAIISFGLASTGCSRRHSSSGEPTPAQIRELQGFGREMSAQYGATQPPIESWASALPWLKFQRLELRQDGAYFIMDENASEERGYAVLESVPEFIERHPDPANKTFDQFVVRYRLTK